MKSIVAYINEGSGLSRWYPLYDSPLAKNVGYKGHGEYACWYVKDCQWEAAFPDKDWPLEDGTKSKDAVLMSDDGHCYVFDKKQGKEKFMAAVEKYAKDKNEKALLAAGFREYEDDDLHESNRYNERHRNVYINENESITTRVQQKDLKKGMKFVWYPHATKNMICIIEKITDDSVIWIEPGNKHSVSTEIHDFLNAALFVKGITH